MLRSVIFGLLCAYSVHACTFESVASIALAAKSVECGVALARVPYIVNYTLPLPLNRTATCLPLAACMNAGAVRDTFLTTCCADAGITYPMQYFALNYSDPLTLAYLEMGYAAMKQTIEAQPCPMFDVFPSNIPDEETAWGPQWGEVYAYLPDGWVDQFKSTRSVHLREFVPTRCFPAGKVELQSTWQTKFQFGMLIAFSLVMLVSLAMYWYRSSFTPLRQRGMTTVTLSTVGGIFSSWLIQSGQLTGFTTSCATIIAIHTLLYPTIFMLQFARSFQLYARYSLGKAKIRLAGKSVSELANTWPVRFHKWYSRPTYFTLLHVLLMIPNVIAFGALMSHYAPVSTSGFMDTILCHAWYPWQTNADWAASVSPQLLTRVPDRVVNTLNCIACPFYQDSVEVAVSLTLIWIYAVLILAMTYPIAKDPKQDVFQLGAETLVSSFVSIVCLVVASTSFNEKLFDTMRDKRIRFDWAVFTAEVMHVVNLVIHVWHPIYLSYRDPRFKEENERLLSRVVSPEAMSSSSMIRSTTVGVAQIQATVLVTPRSRAGTWSMEETLEDESCLRLWKKESMRSFNEELILFDEAVQQFEAARSTSDRWAMSRRIYSMFLDPATSISLINVPSEMFTRARAFHNHWAKDLVSYTEYCRTSSVTHEFYETKVENRKLIRTNMWRAFSQSAEFRAWCEERGVDI